MNDRILYVWLHQALGNANRLSREIFKKFKSVSEIYSCDDFSFLGSDKEKYIKRLEYKDVSEAFETVKACRNLGASIVGYYDDLYPERLRAIPNPPVALYAIGNFKKLDELPCVAVVGTRNPTEGGVTATESFSYVFASSGICVISGLAKGIDVSAHRGCVAANGYTVAVLGCPIGEIYPKENEKAYKALYERGLVISEMYPRCPKTRVDFPNRNRIIAALSDSVVVTEAGARSGALITASYALEYGKRLYSVPGAVCPETEGTNGLLKRGASVMTEPYDVISPLTLEYPATVRPYEPELIKELLSYGISPRSRTQKPETKPRPPEPFAPEEIKDDSLSPLGKKIIALFSEKDCLSVDEMCARLGILSKDILSELTMLEIEERVASVPGGRYVLL